MLNWTQHEGENILAQQKNIAMLMFSYPIY
jgi:hypothetical protein